MASNGRNLTPNEERDFLDATDCIADMCARLRAEHEAKTPRAYFIRGIAKIRARAGAAFRRMSNRARAKFEALAKGG